MIYLGHPWRSVFQIRVDKWQGKWIFGGKSMALLSGPQVKRLAYERQVSEYQEGASMYQRAGKGGGQGSPGHVRLPHTRGPGPLSPRFLMSLARKPGLHPVLRPPRTRALSAAQDCSCSDLLLALGPLLPHQPNSGRDGRPGGGHTQPLTPRAKCMSSLDASGTHHRASCRLRTPPGVLGFLRLGVPRGRGQCLEIGQAVRGQGPRAHSQRRLTLAPNPCFAGGSPPFLN